MFLAVAAGVTTVVAVATTVNDYIGTIGTCPIGSHIISINAQISYSISVPPNRVDWYMNKNPANQLTMPTPGATGGNANRKQIFHEEKGLGPDNLDAPPTKNTYQFLVPQIFQRMGEDDSIQFRINSSGIYDACAKFIYKWKV